MSHIQIRLSSFHYTYIYILLSSLLMRHVTCTHEYIMSRTQKDILESMRAIFSSNESCHCVQSTVVMTSALSLVVMSHVTCEYEYVMSHTQMTLERKKVFFFFALSSFVMRHVTCTHEHVMSHIQISLLLTFFSNRLY